MQPERITYHRDKSAASDEYILGIRKDFWAWNLNLEMVSKSEGSKFKQLTERFCSGNVGVNGLWVAKDPC